jgi:putative SOS response-associated peptidase YedK
MGGALMIAVIRADAEIRRHFWEWWRAKDAPQDAPGLETFTVLTTEPNALCAPIHDRMPVILAPEDWDKWLATRDDRKALLRSYPREKMECWPIGKAVGNVRSAR